MQQLTFEQHLLLMEAVNRLTSKVRDRVAAGDPYLQDMLRKLETIEKTIAAGTVYIEPVTRTTTVGTTNKHAGEAA